MIPIDRRTFVKESLLASAGAALALGSNGPARAAEAPPALPDRLPRGRIGKLEVSRLLLGGNLLTHYTHSRDLQYVYNLTARYNTKEKIFETLALAEANGINTLAIHNPPGIPEMLKEYREKRGGKIQWIVCPIAPVEEDMAAYGRQVQELLDFGANAIYLWGVRADELVGQGRIDLVAKAVDLVRSKGVPSGVGAHSLDVIAACEKNHIAADFYLKTLHHHGYPSFKLGHDSVWCTNPEDTIELMKGVQKPWISFKVMAAGAIPPRDAFQYAFAGGADFSLAGMFDFEIEEDVRIAREVISGLRERPRPWRG